MKLNPFVAAVAAVFAAGSAHAALMSFSGTAVSSVQDNSSSPLSSARYSALIVDLGTAGFDLTSSTIRLEGESLTAGSLLGGDLILTTNASQTGFGSLVVGTASFDAANAFSYNIENASFGILWFDTLAHAGATNTVAPDFYGFATDVSWVIPTVGGAYTFGNGPANDFATLSSLSATTGEITAIPEPSSVFVLAGLGLGSLLLRRRRPVLPS